MIAPWLFDNPILIKHLRSRLRRTHVTSLVLVVVIICGCLLWAGFQGGNFLQQGGLFVTYFALQGLALHLSGMSQVASSIGQVNDSGVLDFHRISPLPPSTTALGFVLGAPIREYLVALLIVPFSLFAAVAGKPGFFGFVATGLVLLSTTWLFHLLAMTAGLLAPRGKTRGTNTGLTLLVVFCSLSSPNVVQGIPIPGLLTAGPTVMEALDWNNLRGLAGGNWPKFFGIELPLWVQSLIYQWPLIVFLSIPVVRRMRSAEASLYSKRTAVAFLGTISLLNMGGIVGNNNVKAEWVIPSLLYLNWVTAMVITMAITPQSGMFQNHLRRSHRHNLSRPPLWADESSNHAAVLLLAGLTYVMVQCVESFVPKAPGAAQNRDFLIPTITAVSTIIYFGFAAQFFAIRSGRQGKIMLFMFLFFVWLLPLILGALCAGPFGANVGNTVASVSPVMGIATHSPIALGTSCGLALLFGAALHREESRLWSKLHQNATVPTAEPESAWS